jgi:putative protease
MSVELLAPAGNLEKLAVAYQFGADAAYIGLSRYSLRSRADNFDTAQSQEVRRVRHGKKLYCALNSYFHEGDLASLDSLIPQINDLEFDAFIVSDLGVVPFLRREFPNVSLHLSTQANCVNSEAAKTYRDLGFDRIILGRETSLEEIARIHAAVPEIELEAFVHGAMCLAYSGRCFLSAWMAERSANRGDCAHSCRWRYKLSSSDVFLEEGERPGEFYPVEEGDGFTTILSSKDLAMIDHLQDLLDAGVTSLKIEGRMKSVYYTAIVTRAYRKMLDHLIDGTVSAEEAKAFRDELDKVSHRERSTGFYYGRKEIEVPTTRSYRREYLFLGTIKARVGPNEYELDIRNQIRVGDSVELIGPDVLATPDSSFDLIGEDGPVQQADHGKRYTIRTTADVEPGFLLRRVARPDERLE